MKFFVRFSSWFAGLAGLLLLAAPAASGADKIDLSRITPVAASEPIPVADFFRLPLVRSPQLNLAGTHIAAVGEDGKDSTSLLVYNLNTEKLLSIGARHESDVETVDWLDDKTVTYTISTRQEGGGNFGVFAASVEGMGTAYPLLQYAGASLVAVPPDDRMHPLVRIYDHTLHTGQYGEAATLDANLTTGKMMYFTRNGMNGVQLDEMKENNTRHIVKRYPIMEPKGGFDVSYLADKNGRLAYGLTSTNGVLNLQRLVGNHWEKCPQDLDEMVFFGAGDKPGEIVVLRERRDGKPRPLQFVDAATNQPGELLFEDAAYDFTGSLYRDPVSHNIVGATFDRSGPQVVWFTESYRELQKAVDHLFPGKVVRILGTNKEGTILLINVFSDRQPSSYSWVDLTRHTAGLFKNSRPWIDPERMQPMNVMKYKTRDGRKLDAYVTLPKGASKKNPPPLVVLPHDSDRARWGYDPEVQFLASRGYAVLQPNYRSSAGYNWMFPTEDEWAFRKMHNDVTDATKALLSSGMVDPKRVAIMGEVFGGYLALSGVAYEPGLYRCAIALAPYCDWAKTIQENKYFQHSSPSYARIVRRLGDPKKEPEKFDAIAPSRHAEDIRAAVLIGAGEYAPTSEINEAKSLVNTVRKNHFPAEFMSFGEEWIYLRQLDHKVEYYSRVESFLAENLAPAAAN